RRQVCPHIVEVFDHPRRERCIKTCCPWFCLAGLKWKAELFPGGKAATQNSNFFRPKDFERPPDARRGEEAYAVVYDYRVALRKAKRTSCGSEVVRLGQHVRQV